MFPLPKLGVSFLLGLGLLLGAVSAWADTVAYIANADSRVISVLRLDEKTGALNWVQTVPVAGSVMPLAISPDRRFLFASLRSEPWAVSSFSIEPKNGHLTLVKTSPLADNMAYISTDRSGRFLLGASYSGDKISINAIAPNGEVAATPLLVRATGKNAHCIVTDASNRFLLATNLGADAILQFRFDAETGKIAPNLPPFIETKPGAGPRHLVFHPNRRFAFATNELDGTLTSYSWSKNGTLTPLASTSVMPAGFGGKPWAADLHLTPNGRFLYASERTSSTLAAFRVDARSGQLVPIGTCSTEAQPRGFNIDPRGRFLLAVGQKSNRLSLYQINPQTGALRHLSQLAVGQNPNWVEVVHLPG